MTTPLFDRTKLRLKPLAERHHKLSIAEIAVPPEAPAPALPDRLRPQLARLAARMADARHAGRPVILAFGAHLIKNGCAPIVIRMIEEGWLTHVATNGAGSIHDWEFAYLGQSTEDVRANTARGEFGTWEETGRFINLAVAVGGGLGLGYGESVGKLIAEDGLDLPSRDALRHRLAAAPAEGLGAAADLLSLVTRFDLPPGRLDLQHQFRHFSVQAAAFRAAVPCTVHPGIGYDIIYTHPMNCGGAIGRGAVCDFLKYAGAVRGLSGGVHLSVGSAVMAPMIFEKSLSMANNVALQEEGAPLTDYSLAVVDIQEGGGWDWAAGEPPAEHPAYYLRFCKTFHRMGGELTYLSLDNRAFLLALYHALEKGTV